MTAEIRAEAERRGISRLCHFTPSRNLVHIMAGAQGVLATRRLREAERQVFTPTDLDRLDGFTDHVCCSIEFPNGWYFADARGRGHDPNFRDWVVMLIDPKYLWAEGVRFATGNAARAGGAGVRTGVDGFRALYAPTVVGSGGHRYDRTPARPESVPTDDQAEVLIPDRIARGDVLGVAVRSDAQAADEYARLQQLRAPVERLDFVVAPTLFRTRELSGMLQTGERPSERRWELPRR